MKTAQQKTTGGEHIVLRDRYLRAKIDAIVARSNEALSLSQIVRAALEEKLEQIEGAEELTMRIRLDPSNGGVKPTPSA